MSPNFFNTIKYQNPSKLNKLFNKVEEFFNLNGRKVIVFDSKNHLGVESQSSNPFWKSAIKIVAYSTVVIPLVLLVGKAIGRALNDPIKIDPESGLNWAIQNQSAKSLNKILQFLKIERFSAVKIPILKPRSYMPSRSKIQVLRNICWTIIKQV